MAEVIVVGEITIFGNNSKPLFSLGVDGAGEWRFQSFVSCEEEVEIPYNSVERLKQFMNVFKPNP